MKTFRDHAAAVTTSAMTVAPLIASAVDLFSADPTEWPAVAAGARRRDASWRLAARGAMLISIWFDPADEGNLRRRVSYEHALGT